MTTSLKPYNCIPNGLATRFHDNTVASISRVPYSQKKNGTRTCDTMKRFLFFNAKTGSFFRKTSCNNNIFLTRFIQICENPFKFDFQFWQVLVKNGKKQSNVLYLQSVTNHIISRCIKICSLLRQQRQLTKRRKLLGLTYKILHLSIIAQHHALHPIKFKMQH